MSAVAEAHNAHAGQGAVLLDIGGDVGALVVVMPAEMEGVEIDVRSVGAAPEPGGHAHDHPHDHPHDHAHAHPHVAVVNRPVRGGVQASLVYPELVAGEYSLGAKGTDEVRLLATVRGGEVSTLHWPG